MAGRLRNACAGLILAGILIASAGTPAPVQAAPKADEWNAVVNKAEKFLAGAKNPNGSWGKSTGITGLIVTGLVGCGRQTSDPLVAGGLKYIESLVDDKNKHIAGKDSKIGLHNYVTSVNVMALTAAGKGGQYKAVVGDAVTFLRKLQWDDGEEKKESDDFFGGAGYDSKSRPDLSNTQFFIDALHAAGVPSDDPSMKKALVFVSRCQNLKSEFNDRPWADKIDDGSFIYSAAGGGSTKTSDEANAPLTGYGSMTYAGIKSMIYCGVGNDDPRMKKALEWVRKNYTLEGNPGMPSVLKGRGQFYYYHTMSKALSAMGVEEFETADGKKHDWKAELTAKLASLQKEDGSWSNPTDRWMEGDPSLVTGYVLMTLSHCKPTK